MDRNSRNAFVGFVVGLTFGAAIYISIAFLIYLYLWAF